MFDGLACFGVFQDAAGTLGGARVSGWSGPTARDGGVELFSRVECWI